MLYFRKELIIATGVIIAIVIWQRKHFIKAKSERYDVLSPCVGIHGYLNHSRHSPQSHGATETETDNWNNLHKTEQLKGKPTKLFKIMYWTPYYKFMDYGFGTGQKVFRDSCGEDYHCEATVDRSELDSSDVILFHNWHIMTMGLPPRRTPDQIYVFNTMEPPLSDHGFDPRKFHDVFNLTMSYRTDSDIPTTYFNKQRIQDKDSSNKDLTGILKSKKRAISWFVSDCHTPSLREEYVKELKKYIPVDIYGKCGIKDVCKKQVKGCMGEIISQYYFYLSFEKILCQDYITEKVMHPYKYKTIPVVRGLGKYEDLMPNNSYIHVNNFDSPRHLADYLHELMNNTDKYLQYFEWRKHYYFAQRPKKLCMLCKFLMDNPGFKSIYRNFTEYWWPTNQCEIDRYGRNLVDSKEDVSK